MLKGSLATYGLETMNIDIDPTKATAAKMC